MFNFFFCTDLCKPHQVSLIISFKHVRGKQISRTNTELVYINPTSATTAPWISSLFGSHFLSEVSLLSPWPKNHTRPRCQAHMKAIKTNSIQTSFGFKSPFCVCISMSQRYVNSARTRTQQENIDT